MVSRKQSGFAILDVVMALFVIATLMLTCCSLLIGSRRLSQQSQIRSAAYQAARQELENLESLKFGNRITTGGTAFTIPASITSQFPEMTLKGSYSIQPYGALASPPSQQIVVKVSWTRVGVGAPTSSSIQLDYLIVEEPGR